MIRKSVRLSSSRGPGRAARLLTVTLIVMTCALAVAVMLLTMGTYKLTQEIGLCGVLTLGPMFGGTLAIGIVVALDYAAGDAPPDLPPYDWETALLPVVRYEIESVRDVVPVRSSSRRNDTHHTTRIGSQRGSHRRAGADRT